LPCDIADVRDRAHQLVIEPCAQALLSTCGV
jgi:hypothetical protein